MTMKGRYDKKKHHKRKRGKNQMKRKSWTFSEEKLLMENYESKTIKELIVMFKGRTPESINNKIKRLKKAGKLAGGKTDTTKQRSYIQRGKDVFFIVDQAK